MASFQEQILQINKLRTAYEKADNAYYSKKLEVQKRLKPAHNAEVIEELKELGSDSEGAPGSESLSAKSAVS